MEVVDVFEGHCEPSFVPFILLKVFFLKEELEGRGRNHERGEWGEWGVGSGRGGV